MWNISEVVMSFLVFPNTPLCFILPVPSVRYTLPHSSCLNSTLLKDVIKCPLFRGTFLTS